MRLNNLLPTATNYCLKREPGKSNGWERLKKDDSKGMNGGNVSEWRVRWMKHNLFNWYL